jgi:hypothetical protein
MIPKITHQIWFQGWDNLPGKYIKNAESLLILNQNWEHKKWDEQSLRKECGNFSSEALAKFDSFPNMFQKIDFGRYVTVYNYGGVSIDCDAECLAPLEQVPRILKENLIVSKWAEKSKLEAWLCHRGLCQDEIMLNNSTIISEKCHPLLKKFIEFLIENKASDTDPQFLVEITTGPVIMSIFFNNFLDDIFILDPEILEPWGRITSRTVINHHYAVSWKHPVIRWFSQIYSILRNNLIWIILIQTALIFLLKFRIL